MPKFAFYKYFRFAFAIFLICRSACSAAVVYSSGSPAPMEPPPEGSLSVRQFIQATKFNLTSGTTLLSATVEGMYASGNTPPVADAFSIAFYHDNGDGWTPGAIIGSSQSVASYSVDTGVDSMGFDIYRISLNFSAPVELLTGTYWVSIYNDTPGDVDTSDPEDSAWFWSHRQGTGTTGASLNLQTDQWVSTGASSFVFTLDDAPVSVPEPTLMYLGPLAAIGLLRRRRAR